MLSHKLHWVWTKTHERNRMFLLDLFNAWISLNIINHVHYKRLDFTEVRWHRIWMSGFLSLVRLVSLFSWNMKMSFVRAAPSVGGDGEHLVSVRPHGIKPAQETIPRSSATLCFPSCDFKLEAELKHKLSSSSATEQSSSPVQIQTCSPPTPRSYGCETAVGFVLRYFFKISWITLCGFTDPLKLPCLTKLSHCVLPRLK